MITATKCIPQGRGLAGALLRRAASVALDWDLRQRSRFEATDSLGRPVQVFLPRGTVVRDGDVLVAEDGALLKVAAAPQPVLKVTACAEHGSAWDLLRAAYHLGNRHVPLQVAPDHLKLEPDPVLQAMLQRMHLIVTPVHEGFDPEAGAYADATPATAADAGHGAPHHHAHPHDHDHDHGHRHGHDHGHDHGHVHDAHCGHDHGAPPHQGHHDDHGHHDAHHGHRHD